ncbi:MAG: hypothetical protein IJZ00_03165 [Lachnospiraceae bacterium]|nr:hypothetical protein [Lachnospiraceae bacterium]
MKKKLLSILVVTLTLISLTGCTDREEELDAMLDECMDYAEERDGTMTRETYRAAMDYAEKYDLEIDEDDLEEMEEEFALYDTQLLNTIRMTLITAGMDPGVNDEGSSVLIDSLLCTDGEEMDLSDLEQYDGTLFMDAFYSMMGVESIDEIYNCIVSTDDANIRIQGTSPNSMTVWLEGTDLIAE